MSIKTSAIAIVVTKIFIREAHLIYDMINSIIEQYFLHDCSLDLRIEDADLLESIWKNKDFIPNDIVPKKKRGIVTINKSKDEKEIDFALKFTYINSLLYLARGLDQRGEFGAEE